MTRLEDVLRFDVWSETIRQQAKLRSANHDAAPYHRLRPSIHPAFAKQSCQATALYTEQACKERYLSREPVSWRLRANLKVHTHEFSMDSIVATESGGPRAHEMPRPQVGEFGSMGFHKKPP
jgi:hypothetical protein